MEVSGASWFILSAKHGLIGPDRVTAPYDATLKDIGRVGQQVCEDGADDLVVAGAPAEARPTKATPPRSQAA